MRKLRLDPESLSVQTFEVAPATPEQGTVRGHNDSWEQCGHTPDGECAAYTAECTYTSCIHTAGCKTGPECNDPTLPA